MGYEKFIPEKTLWVSNPQEEIESLRQQLAECERERDRWKDNYLRNDASEFAAVTKERDELVAAMKKIYKCPFRMDLRYPIDEMHRIAEAALAKVGADKTGDPAPEGHKLFPDGKPVVIKWPSLDADTGKE